MKTIIRSFDKDYDGVPWELKPRVIPDGPSILVVGPDRVGKTTLVQHMTEMTGIPSFKCPNEKEIFKSGGRSSLVFDYNLTHFIQQTGYRFISDRAYPCEWVYSTVFKRETDYGLIAAIDAKHAAAGTKILYVYSSVIPTEEDDIVPSDKYWDIVRAYGELKNWSDCEIITVDTSRMLKAFYDGDDVSAEVAEDILAMLGIVV